MITSYAESIMKPSASILQGLLAIDEIAFEEHITKCWGTKQYKEHTIYGKDGSNIVDKNARGSVSMKIPNFAGSTMRELNSIASKYALENFDTKEDVFRVNFELFSYPVGAGINVHVDNKAEGVDNARLASDDHRGITAVLYLNEDYEGGEIEFPKQNLLIKPKVGELVMFPSNQKFPHLVHPITEGFRNSIQVTWGLINPGNNTYSV